MPALAEQPKTISIEELAYSKLLCYAAMQNPSYKIGKMHEKIADYLEAVERGEIKRLMIFAPPRSGKTMMVSEFFPAWFMGRNPDKHIISCSYSQTRANDVGRKVRNQLDDKLHRSIFPDCQIADDMKSIQHFSTYQNGEFYSMGVGGSIVGRGAHCLCGDSMLDIGSGRVLMMSEVYRRVDHGQIIKTLSRDNVTGELSYNKIIAVRRKITDSAIYKITTDNGLSIRATSEHPIFTHNRGYVQAKNLHLGPDVLNARKHDSCSFPSVSKIEIEIDKSNIVYDIQVERNGNFFANGILVKNCFLIDDPCKDRASAESVLERKKMQTWYRGVAYTRLMVGGKIIIISTRWHSDDLAGWLLREHASENWVVLNMPAIAEENDVLGREPGEALWPEAYPLETLQTIRTAIGSYEWNAQYQQRPVSAEGSIVKHEWLRKYDTSKDLPQFQKIVLSCDTAFKATELADPTAILVWGVTKNEYYLLDVLCRRMEFHELKRAITMMYQKWSASACLVEDRSSGQSLIQEFKRISPIPVIPIKTMNVDKVTRFSSVSHYFESGAVLLPTAAPWLIDYESQITSFPYDKHDDMVDATSQFLIWCAKPRYSFSLKPLFWK